MTMTEFIDKYNPDVKDLLWLLSNNSETYKLAYNQALEDAANEIECDCHPVEGYCNTISTAKRDILSLKKH